MVGNTGTVLIIVRTNDSFFSIKIFRWNMMSSTEQLKSKADKDSQSQYVYKLINGVKMDTSRDSEVK